jgi:AI-2 transport protein TqsA
MGLRIAAANHLRDPQRPAGERLSKSPQSTGTPQSTGAQEPTLRTSLRSASRWWILFAAVLLLIGAMRAAAVVFLPVVLGLVMAMLLAPLAERLARIMWRWLACLITMLAPTLVVILVGLFIWFAGRQLLDHAGAFSPQRALEQLQETRQWLIDRGAPESWLPGGAADTGEGEGETTNPGAVDDAATEEQEGEQSELSAPALPEGMVERAVRVVTGGLGSLFNAAVAIGFAFAFCYFALWELPRWRRWVESWRNPNRSAYALSVTAQWSVHLRRYLLAKAITGVASGAATWLFLWIMGVPLAFVWGGLTFLMNFIPSIGALLSSIPPILLALAELGFGEAMLVAVGLIIIETVAANVLEPVLQGDFLELSPFLVLASLVFWAWVWGALGAVLAPMLTAAAITAAEQLRVKADGRERAEDG